MDFRLKPCATNNDNYLSQVPQLDRLSSLPDEILIEILSLLPTKDVAATCVLSKKLSRVLPWITSLDFDVSPLSLCVTKPYKINEFPCFVNFVDTVLQSHHSQYLNKFRLRLGSVDFGTGYFFGCDDGECEEPCLLHLNPSQINAWIAFPLTPSRYGLTELDLTIWVRDPSYCQLPLGVFTCETLQVLKLDTNLCLDQVYTLPSYRLPNLKLFRLYSSLISNGDFLTRLVSSCPLLEDLDVDAWRDQVRQTVIDSPSIRRLRLRLHLLGVRQFDSCEFVRIHTPNLVSFEYLDNLAYQYSFQEMPSLVKAVIHFPVDLQDEEPEVSYHQVLDFLRHESYAHHLSLSGCFMEDLDCAEVRRQPPIFPKLNHLELGYGSNEDRWDRMLFAFITHCSVLETLVFQEGLTMYDTVSAEPRNELQDSELEFFRTLHAIPLCCRHFLKRIEVHHYFGLPKEVEIIKFLLRHSLILEELVIYRARDFWCEPLIDDATSMLRVLKNLPRASTTCSIQIL